MRIEYLTNTNPTHPKESILRIFDFDSIQACQFKDLLSKLASGSASEIDISDLPFVTPVDGCHLVLKVGRRDRGLVRVSSTIFECILTRLTWDNAEGLVEPFCEANLSGYQWLYDMDTDIQLLFSPRGDW
jgi:hypothetical protein